MTRHLGWVWIVCLFVPTAGRGDSNPQPVGRPKQFAQGKQKAYAVWYEQGTWKLRATCPEDKKVHFTGTITVEGDRLFGDFAALEKAKKGGNADWVFLSPGRTALSFQFATFGKTDGIDFKVGPKAKNISFKLRVAGDDDPRFIFIGARGAHPDGGDFKLPAHPDK